MPSDLSTPQLRHLLLAKLHPSAGVAAFGADRHELLSLAAEHEVHTLSPADVDEVASNPRVQPAIEAFHRDQERRYRRTRPVLRDDAANSRTVLSGQLLVLLFIAFAQAFRRTSAGVVVMRWVGFESLPPCPPPSWSQRLGISNMPGSNGECEAPSNAG